VIRLTAALLLSVGVVVVFEETLRGACLPLMRIVKDTQMAIDHAKNATYLKETKGRNFKTKEGY
jgi:hypothetical protein